MGEKICIHLQQIYSGTEEHFIYSGELSIFEFSQNISLNNEIKENLRGIKNIYLSIFNKLAGYARYSGHFHPKNLIFYVPTFSKLF